MPTSTSKLLAVNMSSQAAAMIFGRVFGAIAGIVLIRYLGAEKQGVYAYIISTVYLFGYLAEFGLTNMMMREMKVKAGEGGKILGNAFIIQVAQVAIAVLIVFLYAVFFETRATEKSILFLAAPLIMTVYLANPFQATLNSYEKMYFTGIAQSLASILNAIAIFTAIYFKFEIKGVIVLLGVSNLFNTVISFILCGRFAVKPVLKPEFGLMKKIFLLSFPFGLSGIFGYIFLKIDAFLIFKMAGAIQTGYYSGAARIIDIFLAALAMLLMPIYPRLSYVFKKEGRDKMLKIINLSLKYMAGILVPFALLVTFYSRELITILLGREYYESFLVMAILIWAVLFMVLRTIFSYALNAAMLTRLVTVVFGFVAAWAVSANLYFIPRFGYVSTAAINVISNFGAFIALFWLFNSRVGRTSIRSFMPVILLASAAMAAILFFVKNLNPLIPGALATAAYAAILLVLGYIGKGEIRIVKNIFSRKGGRI